MTRSDIRRDTGTRIRALRTERSMSLTTLAGEAGIGKATLSGLENGTRNATLETCYALAGVLGVPLAMLIGSAESPTPEIKGRVVTAQLLEMFEDLEIVTELYRLRIVPGATQWSPAHGDNVREFLTVFRGSAIVGDATNPVTVPAGSHHGFLASAEHIYATATDEIVEASLVIRTPRGMTVTRA